MTYDCDISLLSITTATDSMGDTVETTTERTISAAVLTYRSKDFWQAQTEGLKPSITFAVNKYEYGKEQTLLYEGHKYRIIDVFPVKAQNTSEFEALSLLCEAVV